MAWQMNPPKERISIEKLQNIFWSTFNSLCPPKFFFQSSQFFSNLEPSEIYISLSFLYKFETWEAYISLNINIFMTYFYVRMFGIDSGWCDMGWQLNPLPPIITDQNLS